jgi:hypothetical protein
MIVLRSASMARVAPYVAASAANGVVSIEADTRVSSCSVASGGAGGGIGDGASGGGAQKEHMPHLCIRERATSLRR